MRTREYKTRAIIRDCMGHFVPATLKKSRGLTYVLRAESIAAKERLRLALDFEIRAIILESDAKLVLNSFEDLSHNGTILVDAYGLASRFNFFKAHFIPRRCNVVADKLAGLV